MTVVTNLADFSFKNSTEFISTAYIIVKSQNQLERRRNMLSNLKTGRIGRTTQRAVSEGLFVRTTILGEIDQEISAENSELSTFQEPRHICSYGEGFLLTTINELLYLDNDGNIIDALTHPLFAFLHTVCINPSGDKALIVSSGYDLLVEIDLAKWEICWTWCGWDYGFNPNSIGEYCVRDVEGAKKYSTLGHPTLIVDPKQFGLYGLPTNKRTTHPNAATYKTDNEIIATVGIEGIVIEIDKQNGQWQELINVRAKMPHGINPWQDNWIITNTTGGEFWVLNANFKLKEIYSFRQLDGKPEEIDQAEWVQQVVHVKDSLFLALDANRGFVFFDIKKRELSVQKIDKNWCVQDCLIH